MISFLICLLLLLGGYFVYGKVVENTFEVDDRETPAVRINDGVDYVVMPQWKLFLVQLLNIAGLGPHFRSHAGCALGTSGVFMDHLRYDLCWRCPRLFFWHAL